MSYQAIRALGRYPHVAAAGQVHAVVEDCATCAMWFLRLRASRSARQEDQVAHEDRRGEPHVVLERRCPTAIFVGLVALCTFRAFAEKPCFSEAAFVSHLRAYSYLTRPLRVPVARRRRSASDKTGKARGFRR